MTTVKYIVRIDDSYGTTRYMQRRDVTLTVDRNKAGRFTKQYANSIAKQHNEAYKQHPWYGARVFAIVE